MSELQKIQYRLQTISALALSPRENNAFYLEAGDFGKDSVEKDVNIIYPFYQYGAYARYEPQKAQYYIPGSSIKGALRSGRKNIQSEKLLVDDIRLNGCSFELKTLYKLQKKKKSDSVSVEFDLFFPNVAVEMLQAGNTCEGELFAEELHIKEALMKAQEQTVEKLQQFLALLHSYVELARNDKTSQALNHFIGSVNDVYEQALRSIQNEYIIILGGYKGLSLSAIVELVTNNGENQPESAVYMDQDSFLPHGLVRITL